MARAPQFVRRNIMEETPRLGFGVTEKGFGVTEKGEQVATKISS